ncbi:MAG: amidohydrolase, partial [Flavobacterium sp.]|nr:amidohydrolase [Flavobacterium sp.]
MLKKNYKVAAVQYEPSQFKKDYNVSSLINLCEEAAKNGAKLIVTPEMGTTGYCFLNRKEISSLVEQIPGPTTEKFYEIAKKFNCFIVIGLPEVDKETQLYYNTAVLIGPKGIIGKHRKSHSYIAEPKWSAPGQDHLVFDTEIGKIGILICMDIHFIETARLVALQKADIIIHISNWLGERTPGPYWISRAFENSCYLIEGNRWGLERTVQFSGGSCVINPDGSIASVIDKGDGLAYANIDISWSRKRQVLNEKIFDDRRPEMYLNLPTNPYLWNPLDFFGLYGMDPLPKGKESVVSIVQMNTTNNINQNLKEIFKHLQIAKNNLSELVVFPELALTGHLNKNKSAISKKSPEIVQLANYANKNNLYICCGFAEKEKKESYNSSILFGPEGIIGVYRKIHLNNEDKKWATEGNEWKYYDTKIGRIGLMIGYDAIFPESARCLGLYGCDLVLCSSAQKGTFTHGHEGSNIRQNYPIPMGADPNHWNHFRIRGGENNIYFLYANIFDKKNTYLGKSGIFGPDPFKFPREESLIHKDEDIT